jgi:hypothetical protein
MAEDGQITAIGKYLDTSHSTMTLIGSLENTLKIRFSDSVGRDPDPDPDPAF